MFFIRNEEFLERKIVFKEEYFLVFIFRVNGWVGSWIMLGWFY